MNFSYFSSFFLHTMDFRWFLLFLGVSQFFVFFFAIIKIIFYYNVWFLGCIFHKSCTKCGWWAFSNRKLSQKIMSLDPVSWQFLFCKQCLVGPASTLILIYKICPFGSFLGLTVLWAFEVDLSHFLRFSILWQQMIDMKIPQKAFFIDF